jgi:hypothetical protein
LTAPHVSDVAPADRNLTGYDQQHLVTYLRLIDPEASDRQDQPAGSFQ